MGLFIVLEVLMILLTMVMNLRNENHKIKRKNNILKCKKMVLAINTLSNMEKYLNYKVENITVKKKAEKKQNYKKIVCIMFMYALNTFFLSIYEDGFALNIHFLINMLILFSASNAFVDTIDEKNEIFTSLNKLLIKLLMLFYLIYCAIIIFTYDDYSLKIMLFFAFLISMIFLIVICKFMLKILKIFEYSFTVFVDMYYSKLLTIQMFSALIIIIQTFFVMAQKKSSTEISMFKLDSVYVIISCLYSIFFILNIYCFMYDVIIKGSNDVLNKNKGDNESKIKILIEVISVILIFHTCLTYYTIKFDSNSYSNIATSNEFEIFLDSTYYTVISFITLGFGDITPVLWYAKMEAILLGISSLFTLVIFFNLFMSNGSNKNDKDDAENECIIIKSKSSLTKSRSRSVRNKNKQIK